MKKLIPVFVAGLIAAGLGMFAYFYQQIPTTKYTHKFSQSLEIPEFELIDSNRGKFTKDSFLGKWSLVFFGYSRCPDICPTELYLLANAIKLLEAENSGIPQVTFISLDPKRDSSNQLKIFTEHFHKSFIGVTGKPSELDKLARKFGVIYEKVFEKDGKYQVITDDKNIPPEVMDTYLLNHSARIYIVSPEGKIFGIFQSPHSPEKIASDMASLLN